MQRVSQVTFLLRIVSVESAPPAIFDPGGTRMSPACESSPECRPVSKRPDLWKALGPGKYGHFSRKKGAPGRADDGWGGASVSEGSAIVGPVNLPAVTWETLARPRQRAEPSRFFRGPASCRSHLISWGYLFTRVVCTRFFGQVGAPPLAFFQCS